MKHYIRQILTPIAGATNGIFETSPLSANTAGNTLESMMTEVEVGCTSACGNFGAFTVNTAGASAGQALTAEGQGVSSGLRTSIQGTPSTVGTTVYPVPSLWSLGMSNSLHTGNFSVNYNLVTTRANTGTDIGTYTGFENANSVSGMTLWFMDTRLSPANDIMPSISTGAITATVTTPPGAVAYVPITLTNNQGMAFNSNTQLLLTVNTLAYQAYADNNLYNVEFSYFNGTLINSWLETYNSSNYMQGSGLSVNAYIWLRLQEQIVASGGTNTIYMDFVSGNAVNGGAVGMAGYLSLKNSGSCSTYDNGANIFTTYTSFCGLSALPTGWLESKGATVNFDSSNTVLLTNAAGDTNGIFEASPTSANTQGNVLDTLMSETALGCSSACGNFGTFSSNTAGTSASKAQIAEGQGSADGLRVSIQGSAMTSGTSIYPAPSIWSLYMSNSMETGNFSVNYVSILSESASGTNVGRFTGFETGNSISGMNIYYIRTRASPPSNTMPTASFGNLVAS